MAISIKTALFSCTNFPIILFTLALTSHILLHTNDREFCQNDNLMSTIKINPRKIRLKGQKDFTVRQGDFSYLSNAYTNTYTYIYNTYTYINVSSHIIILDLWFLKISLEFIFLFLKLERLINIFKSFDPLSSLSQMFLSSGR